MKKFKSVVSSALALSLMLSVVACSDSNNVNETKESAVTTQETTEATSKETEPTEETTLEETEETEETENVGDDLYTDVDYSCEEIAVPLSDNYAYYMELIDQIHDANPDTEYGFSFTYMPMYVDESDKTYRGYALTAGPWDEDVQTYYFYTGEELIVDDGPWVYYSDGNPFEEERYPAFNIKLSYDDIKSLPIQIDLLHVTGNTHIKLLNSAEDGEYMGTLFAYDADHTKAILEIAKPITITEEEFNTLEVGDTLDKVIDCSWVDGEDVTITSISDGYAIIGNYFLSKLNDLYYLETVGDFYCTTDSQLVAINLDPECEISKDINIRGSINGWTSAASALMTSIVIEDNTVVGLRFRGYGS